MPTPRLVEAGVPTASAVWWNSSRPSCSLGTTCFVTTAPASQKSLALVGLKVQPPPPKVVQPLPQSRCTQIGSSSEASLSPTLLVGLGRNTRGNTLTSQPTVSWRRKRYLAASSILLTPAPGTPPTG